MPPAILGGNLRLSQPYARAAQLCAGGTTYVRLYDTLHAIVRPRTGAVVPGVLLRGGTREKCEVVEQHRVLGQR